ncbi:GNAT family N-acetyltransferase [bacterium]|nr:GNAT family N-acetyltransferase [bacterium]
MPLVLNRLNSGPEPEFLLAAERALDLMAAFYTGEGYPFQRERSTALIQQFVQEPWFGDFFLIQWDSEVVGYAILAYGFSFEYGGKDAFVDELFVVESHRNRGIGSAVLDRLFEHAIRQGIRVLHLETEAYNPEAKALYLRKGFIDRSRSLLSRVLEG